MLFYEAKLSKMSQDLQTDEIQAFYLKIFKPNSMFFIWLLWFWVFTVPFDYVPRALIPEFPFSICKSTELRTARFLSWQFWKLNIYLSMLFICNLFACEALEVKIQWLWVFESVWPS